MKASGEFTSTATIVALAWSAATVVAATNGIESAASAPGPSTNEPLSEAVAKAPVQAPEQTWNWHAQNTDIVQYHPGFPASYSGPNSLSSANEVKETVSVDLYAGARLWRGAEAHVDGLMWQGFGLSKTLGIEGFPNGEAFRLGTDVPNVNSRACSFARPSAWAASRKPSRTARCNWPGSRTCRGSL